MYLFQECFQQQVIKQTLIVGQVTCIFNIYLNRCLKLDRTEYSLVQYHRLFSLLSVILSWWLLSLVLSYHFFMVIISIDILSAFKQRSGKGSSVILVSFLKAKMFSEAILHFQKSHWQAVLYLYYIQRRSMGKNNLTESSGTVHIASPNEMIEKGDIVMISYTSFIFLFLKLIIWPLYEKRQRQIDASFIL